MAPLKNVFVMIHSMDCPTGAGHYGPLARELAKLGQQITVLAVHPNWAKVSLTEYDDAGVHVKYVGQMHVYKEGSHKIYFHPLQLMVVALTSSLRLGWHLSQTKADVVTLCKPQPINSLAVHLGRRKRPIYVDCDDYEAVANHFSGAWQHKIVQFFEDDIVHHATAIGVPSHFTLERYVKLGYPQERIVYFPTGVERSRFENIAPTQIETLRQQWDIANKPVVMYVGTMSIGYHWLDMLLQAYVHVVQRCPTAMLMMVGGGEDYDKLRQMAKELGIADQVIFVGRVAPKDVPAYFKLATLTVEVVKDTPLGRARSPLKVVESLVAGVPVVTGNLGERPAMLGKGINGQAGILVEPDSVLALADGIVEALSNPDHLQTMQQAALKVREQWYWDVIVHQFKKIYDFK